MSIDHEDVKKAIRSVFGSPDGKVLLDYLTRTYYDCKITDENIERQLGRRDVVWTIKQILDRRNK